MNRFIRLTHVTGGDLMLNVAYIVTFRPPVEVEASRGVGCVIRLAAMDQAVEVTQTYVEVTGRINTSNQKGG